ncbi:MAG: FAD-dependent oxidoreductase, partial [Oscillospiraceae bacterium]|nr:FAD-dependent oxidoreductase [Oscillospiraceae bacterium]
SELRDGVVPKAPVKKRVAIVGGGPGGIQALQTLLDRGHDVTLYEKSDALGGNVIGAAAPKFKKDVRDYLKWMRHTAEQCVGRGAKILLNTEATKELLAREGYDAVVIAVGAEPIVPRIPGVDKPIVHWAGDTEADKLPESRNVVVIGGGSVGNEAALDFAQAGKKVTLLEMLDKATSRARTFMTDMSGNQELIKLLHVEGVDMRYGVQVTEIRDCSVVFRDVQSGEVTEVPADAVLLAVGIKPRFDTVDELRHVCPETSVAIVGDCNNVAGTVCEAVNQAFQACLHI